MEYLVDKQVPFNDESDASLPRYAKGAGDRLLSENVCDDTVLDAFAAAVRDGDGRTRCYAAKALGEMRIRKSADLLIALLSDPDPDVRCDAANALGLLRDTKAVGPLSAALEDEDGRLKLCALGSLVKIDDPICVDSVIKAMLSKEDFQVDIGGDLSGNYRWEIQEKAALALGELGDPKAVKALSEFLEDEDSDMVTGAVLSSLVKLGDFEKASSCLKSTDIDRRRNASRAFVHAKDPEAVKYLRDALMDDDSLVRAAAVEAVGRIGGEHEVILLVLLLKDHAPVVRMHTIEAIRKLCGAREAVRFAVQLIEDPERMVRKKAVEILGSIGGPDGATHILKVLTNSGEDESVLCEAVVAIRNSGAPAAVTALHDILLDRRKSKALRASAASALFRFKDQGSLNAFTAILFDSTEDIEVRLAALRGIALFDAKTVIGRFKDMLSEGDAFLKISISRALRDSDDPEAAVVLESLLNEQSKAVRQEAAVSLAWMRNPAGLDMLVAAIGEKDCERPGEIFKALGNLKDEWTRCFISEALRSDNPALRCAAAAGAGQSGSHEFTGALIDMLADEMEEVRREAVIALGKIGDCSAVQPLINAFYNFENFSNIRRDIEISLGKIDTKMATELFLKRLTAGEPEGTQWVAIEAISTISAESGMESGHVHRR